MFTYPKEITNQFFNFIQGVTTIEEIEKWIYETDELLEILGENDYTELLSVFFNGIFGNDDLEHLIKRFYKKSKVGINNEIIIWILDSMIDGTYDVITGCTSLAYLRSFEKGCTFIPIEFVGYDSVIEDMVYRYKYDGDKTKMEKVIELYKIEILKTAKELLDRICEYPDILKSR